MSNTRPELAAQRRTVSGKAVQRLRREGILPAVVYGHGHPSESIQIDARVFDDLRRHTSRNTLIDLCVEAGRPRPVLVHDVQRDPLTRRTLHVDFFLVTMTEELVVDVPIVLTGESPAVDKHGGTLFHAIDSIKVRALPGDLPTSVSVDVSTLESFDDALHVRDLALPAKVTLVTDPDETIAKVLPPRVVEEEAAPAAEAVPVEAAEGAAAPAAEAPAIGGRESAAG